MGSSVYSSNRGSRKQKNLTGNLKRRCQFTHARHRFYTRFGIEYTRKIERELIDMIYNGENCNLYHITSNNIRLYEMFWNDYHFIVVYDRKRKSIVTVLYPDTYESENL